MAREESEPLLDAQQRQQVAMSHQGLYLIMILIYMARKLGYIGPVSSLPHAMTISDFACRRFVLATAGQRATCPACGMIPVAQS